jgi:hypothetical protein
VEGAALGSADYQIEVELPALRVDKRQEGELEPVLAWVREGCAVLRRRLLPYFQRWAELLRHVHPVLPEDQTAECQAIRQAVGRAEADMRRVLEKCEQVVDMDVRGKALPPDVTDLQELLARATG